jgi:hypothetical protein
VSFFDFMTNMGGLFGQSPGTQPGMLQGSLPTQAQMPWANPDQAHPWMNPDQMPQGMAAGSPGMPGQPLSPQSSPMANPQQDNLRRMIYMQQLMGQNGQQDQKTPMQAPPMMPMGQGGMPSLANRFSSQMAQNPQGMNRPAFAQPRMGRYLGLRSLGQ